MEQWSRTLDSHPIITHITARSPCFSLDVQAITGNGDDWSDTLFLLVFPNLRDSLGKGLANYVYHIYEWLKKIAKGNILWYMKII